MLPLQLLQADEVARVCHLDGETNFIHRLAEMGLREGTVLRMIRPGSPCIIQVQQQRMSFRADESATVMVEPLTADSSV